MWREPTNQSSGTRTGVESPASVDSGNSTSHLTYRPIKIQRKKVMSLSIIQPMRIQRMMMSLVRPIRKFKVVVMSLLIR